MRKFFAIALISIALIACQSNKETSVKGVIFDASMNYIEIIDCNTLDTLGFATTDAQITSPNGILLGDTAQIFFTENKELQSQLATKIIITSAAPSIIGSWIQPINGMEGVQGITINADGTAASINMNTLLYECWQQIGDSIAIASKSIGNGQTIDLIEKSKITLFTADSLILTSDDIVMKYARQR